MSQSIDQNIALLQQGVSVLEDIPEFLYGNILPEYFTGSIGKHVRHILNFYQSFLTGIDSGRIDYDARTRDPFVETSPQIAAERIQSVIAQLLEIPECRRSQQVLVHQNEAEGEESNEDWCESTLGREVQSLVSHTVHHFAIIALILRIYGIECPANFGVAPSTLRYERSKECAPSRG